MSNKDTYARFQELNIDNNMICTDIELQDFLLAGLIFKSGRSYIGRDRQKIKVDIITSQNHEADIDLSNLLIECNNLSKENHIKRIYCMSENCYNKYKQDGMIIEKDSKEYFRFFTQELWLVYKV